MDDWRRVAQLVIPIDFDDDLIIIARYFTCREVPQPRSVRIGNLSYVEAKPRVAFGNCRREDEYEDEVELELQCSEAAPRTWGPCAGYRARTAGA